MTQTLNSINQILTSSDTAKKFFINNEDVRTINHCASGQEDLAKPKLYFGSWQIAWIIVKGTVYEIAAFFLRRIADFLECLKASQTSFQCRLLAKHFEKDLKAVFDQSKYGDRFLSPSLNAHRLEDSWIYNHPSIPENEIQDPILHNAGFHDTEDIHFSHQKGLCRGMGLWFFYLFKQTRGSFNDPVAHMRAIGQCFANGGNDRAALIQSFKTLHVALLNIQKTQRCFRFPSFGIINEPHQSVTGLKSLPYGAYSIRVYCHQFQYFKFTDEVGFLFDPSRGVFNLSGAEMNHLLYDYLQDYQSHNYEPGSPFFDQLHFTKID